MHRLVSTSFSPYVALVDLYPLPILSPGRSDNFYRASSFTQRSTLEPWAGVTDLRHHAPEDLQSPGPSPTHSHVRPPLVPALGHLLVPTLGHVLLLKTAGLRSHVPTYYADRSTRTTRGKPFAQITCATMHLPSPQSRARTTSTSLRMHIRKAPHAGLPVKRRGADGKELAAQRLSEHALDLFTLGSPRCGPPEFRPDLAAAIAVLHARCTQAVRAGAVAQVVGVGGCEVDYTLCAAPPQIRLDERVPSPMHPKRQPFTQEEDVAAPRTRLQGTTHVEAAQDLGAGWMGSMMRIEMHDERLLSAARHRRPRAPWVRRVGRRRSAALVTGFRWHGAACSVITGDYRSLIYLI
ncbi:hypothetical protein FB451DRAFT_1366119 [Mycena latifolia]|nr:hypothetical protein FB451DRAFT_1366119 [Mycena latifolia]